MEYSQLSASGFITHTKNKHLWKTQNFSHQRGKKSLVLLKLIAELSFVFREFILFLGSGMAAADAVTGAATEGFETDFSGSFAIVV